MNYTPKFLLLALVSASAPIFAQSWTGIINQTRAIDWSKAGIAGGIPNRTTNCSTLNPGATAAQINSAIASCPAGQVVFLNAGTYNLSAGITFNGHSNVTLRGAGPGRTVLQFTGSVSCGGQGGDICAVDSNPYYDGSPAVLPGGSNAANWTAGYSQGTTQITLDKVSGLSVGSMLILDQANDTSDTGGVFVCDIGNTCQSEGSGNGMGRTIGGVDYSQEQMVKVTAISGNTVTISPGLYMANWRSSQTPKAWWTGQITSVGVENMTVDHTNSSAISGIFFYDCNGCWMKNVTSIKGNRNHVWVYQSSHCVIRDSYFYGTHNAASESYGVETYLTTDDLIENNIFDTIASPAMSASGEGIVWGYNYAVNNYYTPSPNWMETAYANHNAGNSLNLFEGNSFNGLYCDDSWGTGGVNTFFRNQFPGWQSGKSLNTNAIVLQSSCRGYNIIGNVLGQPGYHTTYQSAVGGSGTKCDVSIYQLGYPQTECDQNGGPPPPTDSLTISSLLRWGNFDTVTGKAQWNSAEVPTTGISFLQGNPVPSSQSLPPSFYSSSKPGFWGTMPWPATGPDVTGGNDATGHSFLNPAQTCFTTGAKDANGVLIFDANVCYAAVSLQPPSSVTNITQ